MICDDCANFNYNEYYDCYECSVDLDEDETERFLSGGSNECSYYVNGDDYRLVSHQN